MRVVREVTMSSVKGSEALQLLPLDPRLSQGSKILEIDMRSVCAKLTFLEGDTAQVTNLSRPLKCEYTMGPRSSVLRHVQA
jgi:hypothetical protein